MTWKTQASVGHRQAPVRWCARPRSAIREASLDRCAVRTRAGDESEEVRQGRQRLRPPRELAPLSSRNSFSATPRQGTPLHEPRVPALGGRHDIHFYVARPAAAYGLTIALFVRGMRAEWGAAVGFLPASTLDALVTLAERPPRAGRCMAERRTQKIS